MGTSVGTFRHEGISALQKEGSESEKAKYEMSKMYYP